MDGGERFSSDEVWDHALDIGASQRAEIQAEAASGRMTLEKERKSLECDEVSPGLIELFDQIERSVFNRVSRDFVELHPAQHFDAIRFGAVSRAIAWAVRVAAARTRSNKGSISSNVRMVVDMLVSVT